MIIEGCAAFIRAVGRHFPNWPGSVGVDWPRFMNAEGARLGVSYLGIARAGSKSRGLVERDEVSAVFPTECLGASEARATDWTNFSAWSGLRRQPGRIGSG